MFNTNNIIIVLIIVVIIIFITNNKVSKKEPPVIERYVINQEQKSQNPAYIIMDLKGNPGDTNITVTFRKYQTSNDVAWNIEDESTFLISPNENIYISSNKAKKNSIPAPYKYRPDNGIIQYEIRDIYNNVITPTSDMYDWVSIKSIDGEYVIQPTISGNYLFYKTGQVGIQSYIISATSPCPNGWWQNGNECLQICSNNSQTRNFYGSCICDEGGDNQDCDPHFKCSANICTPKSYVPASASIFMILRLGPDQKIIVTFDKEYDKYELIWDINGIERRVSPGDYIYFDGNKTPSIPPAKKLGSPQEYIHYKLLDRMGDELADGSFLKYSAKIIQLKTGKGWTEDVLHITVDIDSFKEYINRGGNYALVYQLVATCDNFAYSER